MASPTDIISALGQPAALFAADGERLAANLAFENAEPPWDSFAGLADGERLESSPGKAGVGWTIRRLADGSRLVTGRVIEAPSQAYRQFVGALSHEFRTPLNGVLGMAGLLAETRLASDQKAYLASLRDCGEHLLGLVNDVLDLVRLEAGQVTLHPQPLDVRSLLQSTCELLSPRAHAKGLEIAWSVPAALPTVLADGGRLRQILFNLAGNAVKFTETGGALLSAEVRENPEADDGVYLRFLVSDTGPGVPADQRERIFEAFAQADARHAARADSSGLGLAIVRRLAAAHGGAAGLDNTPQGARFWFEARFPVVKAADPTRALADRTVTVVSPSPIVRHAAGAIIEAAGGRAIVCDSLPAGRGQAPLEGAVLLDHALAAASGHKRARLRPLAGRPTIILLAPEDRGHMAAYRAAGFAGYLIKPLRDVSVIERVLAALDGADAKAGAAPDERASPAAAGVRVLLVEDNPINALLARSLLEREGCAVDRAASGEEALAAISTSSYHLILMDQRLPGLDGRATTLALRARGCRAPIIALTADAFEEDRRACLSAGMDDFLTKPLQPSVLRPMLRRWTAPGWTRDSGEAKVAS